MMIETNYISTDQGYLFSQTNMDSYNRTTLRQVDTALYHKTSKTLIKLGVYSSNKITTTYRKYIKIPELAASIGGLYNFLTFIFSIVNLPIKKFYFNLESIETLFVNYALHSKKFEDENSKKILMSTKFFSLTNKNKIIERHENLKDKIQKIKNDENHKKKFN